jgi:DNA-binding transcriptional ArsR family regulator
LTQNRVLADVARPDPARLRHCYHGSIPAKYQRHLGTGRSICLAPIVPLTYNQMVVGQSLTEEDVDRIFRALADRTRRDILRRAVQSGESISVLSRHYEMSFAAVQKHAAVLERAGLVTKERRGREQIVHADRATLGRAMTLLDAFEQLWIQRVDQINDILAITEGESK